MLGALLIRELLTRYWPPQYRLSVAVRRTDIFTLGVTALWTATKSVHGSDLPIVAFALTGYSSVLLWRNMPGRCIGALEANSALMYSPQYPGAGYLRGADHDRVFGRDNIVFHLVAGVHPERLAGSAGRFPQGRCRSG